MPQTDTSPPGPSRDGIKAKKIYIYIVGTRARANISHGTELPTLGEGVVSAGQVLRMHAPGLKAHCIGCGVSCPASVGVFRLV